MRDALHIVIVGDDFTPAALFEEALHQTLSFWRGPIAFTKADKAADDLVPVVSDEVQEAFGDAAQVARLVRDAAVLITTFAPVTAEVIAAGPGLLAIACGRGGPVNVNLRAATAHGVPVLNAPGRNARAVAEYTVAGMLNLLRRIPRAIDYVRRGEWQTAREDTFEKPSGPELGGKVVGLIGFGQVGRLVARLALAFGARVLVFDPLVDKTEVLSEGCDKVDLSALLAQAEVISIHARLPADAPPILGEAQFAAMARRPYLLNSARASAIDQAALLRALESGALRAVLLDVHPTEPIPRDSPLLKVDPARLLLTPHAAGVSHDVPASTAWIVGAGLADLLRGKTPANVMNPEALDRYRERLRQQGWDAL